MTGYQEIFTDPSYFGQILVMTTAHIGNYGTHAKEIESEGMKISGMVIKKFSDGYSRPSGEMSLQDCMVKNNNVGISDIDTRALVRHIRNKGAMNAIISSETLDLSVLKAKLKEVPSMDGLELSSKVATKVAYEVKPDEVNFKVSLIDFGVKKSIVDCLVDRGCHVKVFPLNSTIEDLNSFNPDGYMLSNGPGDPEPLKEARAVAKEIINKDLPLFGICLGHQVIALANGVSTYKMHNGHRGINHPVKNIKTGKGEITSQNHGFAVNREDAEKNSELEITHVHLNDHTVAGLAMRNKNCFSVQYHPEASPGPHDSSYLFDQFIENIKKSK